MASQRRPASARTNVSVNSVRFAPTVETASSTTWERPTRPTSAQHPAIKRTTMADF